MYVRARWILSLLFATTLARADQDLVIITPHNLQIQQEFETAFVEHMGKPIKIRWIKQGTGQLLQMLAARDRGSKKESLGFDVFFGGGVADHDRAASEGFLQAPDLPKELLDQIPAKVAGFPTSHPKQLWTSSALSTFGILINRLGLQRQKLKDLKTWEDLADPQMYGWVVMADPRNSASVRVSYEAVIQEYGWKQGWGILTRMAANSRLISDSSSAVPNEVATGNVIAGPCIDFYAYARIAQAGEEVLEYVTPMGGTAITPDPVSMLRSPPHLEMANEFIKFVLSAAGQRLWILPAGVPGGPKQSALYRVPIRPDVYQGATGRVTKLNPFEAESKGVFRVLDSDLQRARMVVLSELMGTILVDMHAEMSTTWSHLIKSGLPEKAVDLFEQVPLGEKESLRLSAELEGSPESARSIRQSWIEATRQRLEAAEKLCGE